MSTPPSIWDGVLKRLQVELPDFVLEAWIRPLVAIEAGDGLRLCAPSSFHRNRVEDRFLAAITKHASEEAGREVAVEVGVGDRELQDEVVPASDGPARKPRSSAAVVPEAAPPVQAPLPHSFDSFIVGPANALAREASLAVAHGRRLGSGPLFLCASTGNGKTHLARAVHALVRRHQRSRAVYVSAEGFTSDLLRSIRARETGGFKRRFREQCGLLVVEDVQFFAGKAASQLELFHTLEHLRVVGVPVVLTAERLPRDIPDLEGRLGSQMSSGLVAEIEPPDASLRREILRAKAAAGGVKLPTACLDRLVEAVRGSVRDLEGVLIQLVQSAALLKHPIDLELTERALRKVAGPGPEESGSFDVDAVVQVVAAYSGLRPADLRSRSKRRAVLVPRQLAMYLCRRFTDASLAEIGRALNRDHPSVRNAVDVVERAILERAPLRYKVEELAARLEALRS
jgi:chromosomal replication initiator protein